MTPARSSLQAVVRLLEVFRLSDEQQVRVRTVEAAAESLGAPVAGIVCGASVIASIGLGDDDSPLIAAASVTGTGMAELAPLGAAHVLSIPIDDTPNARFVLGRFDAPFDREESAVARAMVRLMRLAVRTIGAFQEQQSAATALEAQVSANQQLAEGIRRRHVTLMHRFTRIQQAVTAAASNEDPLDTIVVEAGRIFDRDEIDIRLVDGDFGRIGTSAGLERLHQTAVARLPAAEGIWSRAITESQLVVESAYHGLDGLDRPAMATPIYRRGMVAGAMFVVGRADRVEPYDEEEQEALLLLAGYASLALTESTTSAELHRSLADAEWRAGHDQLTGLPNRSQITRLLEQRLATGQDPIVLYIDLDGFKSVNDLYGHATGDQTLLALACRISMILRPGEVVGRLAGDEFVVILPSMDRSQALAAARRIGGCLNEPLDLDGRELLLPASVGIARSVGGGAEDLLDAADIAMYRAKRGTDERISFYDDGMREERRRQIELEQHLRLALPDLPAFHLAYQPIYADPNAAPHGFEVLLRWTDPALREVTTDEFIAVAETMNIVTTIDEWVLRTTLEQMARFALALPGRVAVNLSAASFLRPDLGSVVAGALAEAGVNGPLLAVEITERVMLGDPAVVTANIDALRRLGVAVVLDDFGTGYSSLSYLHDLHVDGLKVDRSLVHGASHDRRGRAILRAVLGLSADLGIEPVAEGVETAEQLAELQAMGVTRFQGYLLGRPGPLERWLRDRDAVLHTTS